jgi:hypothetical protein
MTNINDLYCCIYMVPRAGIEPAQPQGPRDFKSLASTSSATQAIVDLSVYPGFSGYTCDLGTCLKTVIKCQSVRFFPYTNRTPLSFSKLLQNPPRLAACNDIF